MTTAKQVLKQARDLARSVETWADLSNALFDPANGLVTRAYPSRAEREAFMKTEEYQKIRELLHAAIDTFGLVEAPRRRVADSLFVCRAPFMRP